MKIGDKVRLSHKHPYRPAYVGVVTKIEDDGVWVEVGESEKHEFAYNDEYDEIHGSGKK